MHQFSTLEVYTIFSYSLEYLPYFKIHKDTVQRTLYSDTRCSIKLHNLNWSALSRRKHPRCPRQLGFELCAVFTLQVKCYEIFWSQKPFLKPLYICNLCWFCDQDSTGSQSKQLKIDKTKRRVSLVITIMDSWNF